MNTTQTRITLKKHGQKMSSKSLRLPTDSKYEPGSEMKVKGEYMGRREEMRLEVVDKEPHRKLVTRQIEGHLRNGKAYKN